MDNSILTEKYPLFFKVRLLENRLFVAAFVAISTPMFKQK